MATTTTITKMLFRRGNDTDRQQTILASGEPGWTLDTKRLWIGDGITPGGYPALSGADQHLRYVDGSGNIGGGPQKLDLNVGGLSATLVGDGEYPKSFHSVDRTISTEKPLQFNNLGQHEEAINYIGDNDFHITRGSAGVINIANALKINVDAHGNGSLEIAAGAIHLDAATQILANGVDTWVQDKTIDLNVMAVSSMENGERVWDPQDPGDGLSSEKTGIYISHDNYLSAGHIAVGAAGSNQGWSTIEIQPPVYHTNWLSDEQTLKTRLDRGVNTTNSWTGVPMSGIYSSHKTCKPITFKSARPYDTGNSNDNSYDGDINVVLETGLIVYGPGDDEIGEWNGYLINQSVDTGAHPTFTGITIENTDGKPGAPINVRSGGTGNNSLSAGGVILSHETDPEGNLRSMVLESGELVTGSDTGAKATKLSSNSWMDITSNDTTGVITINNRLAPKETDGWTSVSDTQTKYFHKWYNIAVNTGNMNPEQYQESMEIKGDGVSQGATTGGSFADDVNIYTRLDTGNKIIIEHRDHADVLFNSLGKTDPNTLTATFTAADRQAISSITFNKAGHISAIGTMNPGDNYLQLDHVGSEAQREGGSITSPDDITASAATSTPVNDPGITQNDTGHATVITGLDFNDYGTVHATNTWNLKKSYYNKKEIGDAVSLINGEIDDLKEALGNAAFLKSDESTITTGASMTTSFRDKAIVAFGSNKTTDITKLSQQTDSFDVDSGSNVNIMMPAVNTGAGNSLSIKHGTDIAAQFTNKTCSLRWNNGNRLITTSTGVEIFDECKAKTFVGDGSALDLSNNTSIKDGDFVKKSTGGTFAGKVVIADQLVVQPGPLGDGHWALNVGGRGFFTGNLTTMGTLYSVGDVIAFYSSDKRLKNNLTVIPDPLNKISQISGYEFDWSDKQSTYEGHDVGVVAQEVEKVIPEIVVDREDGYKAVKYEKLVPLLIECIKELNHKIEKLEKNK